jgi:multiple sugar transport system permease protein
MLGYLFLIPSILLLFTIIIAPAVISVYTSFTNLDLVRIREQAFVGLSNYYAFLKDPVIAIGLQNSLVYVLGTVTIGFLSGLVLALALNENIRGREVFRTAVLLPWVVPSVVTALLFQWMYSPQFGPIDALFMSVGLMKEPLLWSSPSYAMLSVILASVWRAIPFHTLMLLAGLQTIPTALYEAAKVDGASALRKFWHITLPSLKFVIAIDTTLQAIWSFQRVDIIYVLTEGGPVHETDVLALLVYKTAFLYTYMGYAASMGVMMLIILLGLTIVYWRLLRV